MGLREKATRGWVFLTLGEGLIYGCSFARNMVLARVLTKADFGIAASFALITTLLEFSGKLGLAVFLVRDKDGDRPDFLATTHLLQFATSTLSAILIAGCAGPLSRLFGIPEQRWAIMVLALIPWTRGLEHLDVRRFERHVRFEPALLIEVIPQVIVTAAVWPVAHWLGDYRAVLVLLLSKGLATCVASHLLAEQRYRWRGDWAYVRRMLRFGWPLLINGFLMFAYLQGDQFLIAASYTMGDLAPYSAAVALTMAPTFFFGRVFNSVMLPLFAAVQQDPGAFARRYRQALGVVAVFAVASALGLMLGGEAVMRVVYGHKYAGAGALLAWLAAANAFRNLRLAPALAAIAKGDSKNQMISNSGRLIALLPAIPLALSAQPLWTIACTGLVGEALACWLSFGRLRRRDGVPLSVSLVPGARVLLAVGVGGVCVRLRVHELRSALAISIALLGASIGSVWVIATLPELRREARQVRQQWRQAGWRGPVNLLLRRQDHPA